MSEEQAIDFCKVDSDLDANPKIRKAGCFGRDVFEFVLRCNRRMRRHGDVPLRYLESGYLAEQLMLNQLAARLGMDAEALARSAVEDAVAAELLELDQDAGLAIIVGWDEEWGTREPKPGRERTKAWRDRTKQLPAAAETAVTTERHGDAIEIRSEERRGEDQSLHSGSDIRPELPDPGATARADLGAAPEPPPGIPQPGRGRNAVVQLNTDAWRYAAMKHAELGLDGSLPWPAMPAGAAMHDLTTRVREVLEMHDPPRFDEAKALITRRIDVAFSAAQREQHAKWFTPTRMWDAKSFWRDLEVSPAQARAPRAPPRGSPPPPTTPEPRKIKTLG